MLEPLLIDLIILEIKDISVKYENIVHHFQGSISMVVAGNLAAHALGGHFHNFTTVSKFCRFCNFTRSQMLENFNSNEWVLSTKEAYDSNIAQLEGDPAIASAYSIKSCSPLHVLKYFHVIDGLPPDLAHDVFEGIAIDILSQIMGMLWYIKHLP